MAGHIYGNPSESIYPSSSLLHNINKINKLEPSFFMLLGDNYRLLDSVNVLKFKSTLINRLEMPVFNALGNHDLLTKNKLKDYKKYKYFFPGLTYYSYTIHTSLFIVLDTEKSNGDTHSYGNIEGKQLEFLKKELQQQNINNIFICAHRDLKHSPNFKKDLAPLFSSTASSGIQIYLLSGDMHEAPSNLYIEKDSLTNFTHVHLHIEDNIEDKILQFHISSSGKVTIIPISLEGTPLESISFYTKSFNLLEEGHVIIAPSNKPLSIFEKTSNLFTNKNFYEGIAFALLVIVVLFILKKRLMFLKK